MVVITNTSTSKCAEQPEYGELQYQDDGWCSEKHVQIWINNIDANESLHDEFSPKTSSVSSVPMSDDEMEIGADAHHYNQQKIMLSPRLSPLMPPSPLMPLEPSDADNLLSATNLSAINTGNLSDAGSSLRDFNLKILEACKSANTENDIHESNQDEHSIMLKEDSGSLLSYGSSFDNPSALAAVLQPDPEDILINLGFGGGSDVSLLQTVPSRFLRQPSTLSGIDVEAFQKGLVTEVNASSDNTSSVPRRFSIGSLSCDSICSLNAECRRVLFKSSHTDIPSIHLSYDACSPAPSTSVSLDSAQRGRLSTLAELPEPSSRRSSFDEELSNEVAEAFSKTLNSELKILTQEKCNIMDLNTSYKDNETQMEEEKCALNSHICDMYTNLVIPSIKRSDSDKSGSSNITIVDREGLNIEDALTINASLFKPITNGVRENSPIQDIDGAVSEVSVERGNKSASSKRTLFQNNSTSKYPPERNKLMHDDSKLMDKTEVGLIDEVSITNNIVLVDEEGVVDEVPLTEEALEEYDVTAHEVNEVMTDEVAVVHEMVVATQMVFEEAVGDDIIVVDVGDEVMTNAVANEVVVAHEMVVVPNTIDMLASDEVEVVHELMVDNETKVTDSVTKKHKGDDAVVAGSEVSEADVIVVSDEADKGDARMDDDLVVSNKVANVDTYPPDTHINHSPCHDGETLTTNTTNHLTDRISVNENYTLTCSEEGTIKNAHKVVSIQNNGLPKAFSIDSGSEGEQGNVKVNTDSEVDDDGDLNLIKDLKVFEDTQKLIEEIKEILLRPNIRITSVPDDNEIINESSNELQMINDIRDILLKPSHGVINSERNHIKNYVNKDIEVENDDEKGKTTLMNEEVDEVTSNTVTVHDVTVQMNVNDENVQFNNCDILQQELLFDKNNTCEQSGGTCKVNDVKIDECIDSDFETFQITKGGSEIGDKVLMFSNVHKSDDNIEYNRIITPGIYAEESVPKTETYTINDVLDKANINTNTVNSSGNNTCVNRLFPVPGSGNVFEEDDDLKVEPCPAVLNVNCEENLKLETNPPGNTSDSVSMDSKLNEAFKDFFWKLKEDSKEECIPISSTEINENIYENNMNTNIDSLKETCLVQDDSLIFQQNKTNSENKKSAKSYLSAAFHSLTTALGKYQDSKQSKCSDNIVCSDNETPCKQSICNDDISRPKDQKQKLKKKSFFNIFNHRTANLQTGNTFPILAANILEGKAGIDTFENEGVIKMTDVKDEAVSLPSLYTNVTHNDNSLVHCSNCKAEQTFSSQSSIEKIPDPLPGYIPDSPLSSDEHPCTSIRNKRKRCITKPLKKGVSMESSGFDEDTAKHKCPLGKKYYNSTNIPSYIPSDHHDNISKLPFAKEIEKLMNDTKCHLEHNYEKCDCGRRSYYGFISDGHFEYVIQQLTRVRTEINTHFDLQAKRESELKLVLNNQVSEMKQIMTSEYMGWILREMDSLKGKLKEKDDEIEKLRRESYERH